MPEENVQADLALMDEFAPETEMEDMKTETTNEEWLDYYYNMMLPDLQAASIEDKMDFVKKVLNS